MKLKRFKLILIILLLSVLMIFLSGCGLVLSNFDRPSVNFGDIKELASTMVTESGDTTGIYDEFNTTLYYKCDVIDLSTVVKEYGEFEKVLCIYNDTLFIADLDHWYTEYSEKYDIIAINLNTLDSSIIYSCLVKRVDPYDTCDMLYCYPEAYCYDGKLYVVQYDKVGVVDIKTMNSEEYTLGIKGIPKQKYSFERREDPQDYSTITACKGEEKRVLDTEYLIKKHEYIRNLYSLKESPFVGNRCDQFIYDGIVLDDRMYIIISVCGYYRNYTYGYFLFSYDYESETVKYVCGTFKDADGFVIIPTVFDAEIEGG